MNDSVKPARTAFMLSQVGAFSSAVFADEVRPYGLTPASAGVLRILGRSGGLSQRELATRLGSVPSRVVVLVDTLEKAGLVTRERSADDRRNYRLTLTESGQDVLARLRDAAHAQEARVLGPLTAEEREALEGILGKLLGTHGLDRDIHMGTLKR